MRIQHNIPAMSSYRNYSRNVSAVNKNLEKLSSGYKINRAGDDAAGLAISEKMRLQISGLEQAQNNAKSGINLVQTAEGALTEVHDMLNRMYTLAEQSANGTYSDDVDREQLQKEVDSLRTEINRIADATNYNGIKLLNGDLDSKATAASTTWSDPSSTDVSIGNAEAAHTDVAKAVGHAVHKDGVKRAEPTFTVDLSGVEFTASDTTGFNVTIGGRATALTVNTSDGTTAIKKDDVVSGENLAKAIAAAVNAVTADGAANSITATDGKKNTNALKGIKIGDNVYKAEAKGSTVVFTLQDKDDTNDFEQSVGDTAVITQTNVKFDDASHGKFTGLDVGGHANTKIDLGIDKKAAEMAHATIDLTGKISDGTKLTIGEQTYIFKVGKESKVTNDNKGDATVIDLSDVDPDTDTKLVDKAIAKLTKEDNSWFRLESGKTGLLTAVEKADADGNSLYKGEGDITTKDGLQSNFSISQMTYAAASEGDASKALTLQIGDTADDYNKLTVSIKDMHAVGMGIDKIDISTQKGASDAMKAIQNATNYVSDVRGSLGALQNRLDHTINNLSVTQENIQDAESTIRDVDIAKEMMAYTKNNILVQSAQAMLAQANQLPQGVLQLLG